jgi:pimeloyl-ACP methyl ester carboxylesterase
MAMHWIMTCVILFLLLSGLCLGPSVCRAEERSLEFHTADQVLIHVRYWQGASAGKPGLIIVAPGYAQHSGTASMQTLAMALTPTADVVIVDFRGNGKSGGKFTFGAKEYLDLEPVLAWAKTYPDITLLGFSLGAYHSIRAASRFPGSVQRLLLVSCPTRLEDIVSSGGAFLNPLALLFRKVSFRYPPENDLSFRWTWPFSEKPDSAALVAHLAIPCHFLVGGQDTLVFERLSRKVYAAAAGEKSYTRFEKGVHAEAMFLQFPERFMAWVLAKRQ